MFNLSRICSFKLTAFCVSLCFISTVFYSCDKDYLDFNKLKKPEWNPNIAAPLAKATLTIEDLLLKGDSTGLIQVDSNNFCTIMYSGNLLSVKASDIINIPDQNFTQGFGIAVPVSGSGTLTVSNSQIINFDAGNTSTQVDSLIYKSGIWDISINSDFPADIGIELTIPEARKNGKAFTKKLSLDYKTTVPLLAADSVNLSGYHFDMTNGGTATNQIKIDYTITISYAGVTLLPTNKIQITNVLRKNKFDKVFGYIGQMALSPDKDTVDINIFNSVPGNGTFTLVNPKVKVTISNSYGVPIQATFSKFDGYSSHAGGAFPIGGSGLPNPLTISNPNINQIGQTLKTSFTIDNSNSNIASVISKKTEKLIYEISSVSNPKGKVSQNFVIDSSRFKVDMEVELPLYGTASGFMVQDTFDLKLPDVTQVNMLLLRALIDNGFPLDIGIQAYFTDDKYKIIDSLFIPNQVLIPSGIVDAFSGKITSATPKTIDCTFGKDRLNKLENTKKMILKGKLATYNDGKNNVKLYSNYKLNFRLVAQSELSIKP